MAITNYNTRWTAEADQQLRKLIEARVPHGRIAQTMGRTKTSVAGRAQKLGLASLLHNDTCWSPTEEQIREEALKIRAAKG